MVEKFMKAFWGWGNSKRAMVKAKCLNSKVRYCFAEALAMIA
jgi:hypothetical protein